MERQLIDAQQEYIDTVNSALARWSHRRNGGHSGRTIGMARKRLKKYLNGIGVTDPAQVRQIIKDAADVAEMERLADV